MDKASYNSSVAASGMPARIGRLPISPKGFPVPWFVKWIDGVPDFRVVDATRLDVAIRQRRCFVCGGSLGRMLAFTIGPMCAVNRVISEPPSHRECATYTARVCPFLSNPAAQRREAGLPEDRVEAAGLHIRRNPGVVAVWVTRQFEQFRPDGGGMLFQFGEPSEVLWFAEGRTASRAEVMRSMQSGLSVLFKEATAEGDASLRMLDDRIMTAMRHVPAPELVG